MKIMRSKQYLGVIFGVALVAVAHGARATAVSGDLTGDNYFFAYISTSDSVLGTLVASGNEWWIPQIFRSVSLAPGNDYLHIEVINNGYLGGFLGQFTLSDTGASFTNGLQTLLTDTTDWRGAYNNGNSSDTAQSWVMPTDSVVSFGQNSDSPWYIRPGISGNADWIWPDDTYSLSGAGACSFCTVDFSTLIDPVPEPSALALLGAALIGFGTTRRRKRS
jgi:PEP-CTERM motif-containing protein